ncbi:MAG: Mrp/NBP35 family ATP-binding protein [Gemmatimonadota bacterium]|nr:Mrp/NBP35 family ATP-binding protein [Gemmatimonadota bacterium]
MTLKHRTYSEVTGADASRMVDQVNAQQSRVAERLAGVKACVAVMSGKGGVGKSLTTAAIAAACAARGLTVGLLDADLVGPSAARMSGVNPTGLEVDESGVDPATSPAGVRVMSMDLLIEDDTPLAWREPGSESFVWRGAQERGALREFLADVRWGELDLLLVDLPPGTQRLIDLAELLPCLDGLVVITIPSAASEAAVSRSMSLAAEKGIRILGVVENMAGYACGDCGEVRSLFPGDAGQRLADQHDTTLLGRIPFDPDAAGHADMGALDQMMDHTVAGAAIEAIVDRLLEAIT